MQVISSGNCHQSVIVVSLCEIRFGNATAGSSNMVFRGRGIYLAFTLAMCLLILITFFMVNGQYTMTRTKQRSKLELNDGTKAHLSRQSYEIKYKFKSRKFPDAIIIGVRKGGTTALRKILHCHPSIQTAQNEVVYFSHPLNYEKGLSWYIERMPLTSDNQLTIEKSPQYFLSPLAPERLYRVSKTVKTLLIVRNPLVRTVSDYYFQQRKGLSKLPFYKKVFVKGQNKTINTRTDEIKHSMYDVHYKTWLKWFPKKQIHIVNGDNLKTLSTRELNEVEKFLGVPFFFKSDMISNSTNHYYFKKCENSTEQHKGASVGSTHVLSDEKLPPDNILKAISAFLQPHAREFCRVASVKFSWCSDIYGDAKAIKFN